MRIKRRPLDASVPCLKPTTLRSFYVLHLHKAQSPTNHLMNFYQLEYGPAANAETVERVWQTKLLA